MKFILTTFLVFYIPGSLILKALKAGLSGITYITLSLVVGLFASSQISKIFFNLGIQRYLWGIYAILALGYLVLNIRNIKKKDFKIGKFDIYSVFLICLLLIMVFVVWYSIFPSGRVYPEGMRFFRANAFDSMNQWAMSEELARPLPRQFPFWAGESMTGYHIGAYYWRGLLFYLVRIDPIALFLRFSPLFLKILLVVFLFSIIKEIKNRKTAILSALSVFFLGDLSWFLAFLDKLLPFTTIKTLYFYGNILQPLTFNPPLVYGFLAVLGGIFFLNHAKEKKTFLSMLLSGYFFGMLFSSKTFFGIVFVSSLFILSAYEILRERDSTVLKIFLATVIFSFIELGGMFEASSGSIFKFNPFYFPADMMALSGPGILPAASAFAIFTVGSIGIKIPGLFKAASYAKNFRANKSFDRLFVISLVLAFILTHLFTFNTLYKGATINFYMLFLFILSIYFAEWLGDILEDKTFFRKGAILCAVSLYAVGTVYFSVLPYTPEYNRYKLLTKGELEALDFIRHNTEEDAVIIHNRRPGYWYLESTRAKYEKDIEGRESFVSALGGRRVVLECSWHVGCGKRTDDFEKMLKERKDDVKTLYSTGDRDTASGILSKYRVSHVWIEEGESLSFRKRGILSEVFSNNAVTIYKVVRERG